MEHDSNSDTKCDQCIWDNLQMIGAGTWGLRNNRTSGDHPNNGVIKIRQNTENSPGDLWELNKEITLVWKTFKKVIHWEMCKKFKFDHTNKWYMHHPAPVIENSTHKLLWDFDIHTDHLISARRPDLIITNKKKEILQNCRLCCAGWAQNKTEKMWKEG